MDGSQHEFKLEHWSACDRYVVGRWVAVEGNPFGMEPGSYSWGVWPLMSGSVWGAYRMHAPDGQLLKYRFDAVDRVQYVGALGDKECGRVVFHDLLLDAVVDADGNVRLLDEAEVETACELGKMSKGQIERLQAFRSLLLSKREYLLLQVDEAICAAVASKRSV